LWYCGWHLCVGTGIGDSGGCCVSGRCADVFGVVSADCLWLLLFETLKEGIGMKIVIWKAPKLLRGILARIFLVQE
jgi:hypothetical protein